MEENSPIQMVNTGKRTAPDIRIWINAAAYGIVLLEHYKM